MGLDPLALALLTHHPELANQSLRNRLVPVIVPHFQRVDHGPDYELLKSQRRAKIAFLPVKPVVDSARALINGVCEREPTIALILSVVCDFYGVKPLAVKSARRAKTLTLPRHVAMYLARELTTRSFPEIGRRIGNRDHTSVMHACRKINDWRKTDGRLSDEIEVLTLRIMDYSA